MQEKFKKIKDTYKELSNKEIITENMTIDQIFYQTNEFSENLLKKINNDLEKNYNALKQNFIENSIEIKCIKNKEEVTIDNANLNKENTADSENSSEKELKKYSNFEKLSAKEALKLLDDKCNDSISFDDAVNSEDIDL